MLPALLVAACEEDPPFPSPLNPSFDSGIPDFDAGPVPVDADVPDAPDASDASDAAVAQGVSILVIDEGAPVEGVLVLFHDEDGALTGEARTDATGKVKVEDAPSQVTVVLDGSDFSADLGARLFTYTHVEDGDALVVDATKQYVEGTTQGKLRVTLPGLLGGASYYQAHAAPCSAYGSPAAPFEIRLEHRCLRSPSTVLAAAMDEDGMPLGYAFEKGIVPPMPAPSDPQAVDVILDGSWSLPDTVELTAPNVEPDSLSAIGVLAISEGAAFPAAGTPLSSQDGPWSFFVPAGFAEALQVYRGSEGVGFSDLWLLRRTPPASSVSLDFSQALPRITSVDMTGTTGQYEVSWTTEAPVTAIDGAVVTIMSSVEVSSVGSDIRTWTIMVPPGTTSVRTPELPASVAALAPSGVMQQLISLVEADMLSGYSALKALPMRLSRRSGTPIEPHEPLPGNGTVRFSTWNVNG